VSTAYYPLKPIKFADLHTIDFGRVGLSVRWEGDDNETCIVTDGRATIFLYGNIRNGSLHMVRWFAPNAQCEHLDIVILIYAIAAALKCDIRSEYETVYSQPNTAATLYSPSSSGA